MARKTIDTIVIGAGHNGLVAAAYLAKGGRNVLVLERSERTGGVLRGGEPAPASGRLDRSPRSAGCAPRS